METQTTNRSICYAHGNTSPQKKHIEGSRPEWCISSMIYSRDTPFWSRNPWYVTHMDQKPLWSRAFIVLQWHMHYPSLCAVWTLEALWSWKAALPFQCSFQITIWWKPSVHEHDKMHDENTVTPGINKSIYWEASCDSGSLSYITSYSRLFFFPALFGLLLWHRYLETATTVFLLFFPIKWVIHKWLMIIIIIII